MFVSNTEACEMMRAMNFRLLSVLPRAGRLRDGRSRTDAMQFYLPLHESKQKPAARALTSEGTDDARDEEWMKRAMELAERAKEGGEIPVGAVVVLGDDLVGEGCNMIRANVDPSGHAEMIAIRQAAQRLGNYR